MQLKNGKLSKNEKIELDRLSLDGLNEEDRKRVMEERKKILEKIETERKQKENSTDIDLKWLIDETNKDGMAYLTAMQIVNYLRNEEIPIENRTELMCNVKMLVAANYSNHADRDILKRYGAYCVGENATFSGILYASLIGVNDIKKFASTLREVVQDTADNCVEVRAKRPNFKDIKISLETLDKLGLLKMLQMMGVELHITLCEFGNLVRDSESTLKVVEDGGILDSIIIYNNVRTYKTVNTAYIFMHEIGHLIHTVLESADSVPKSFLNVLDGLGAYHAVMRSNEYPDLFADVLAIAGLFGTKAYIENLDAKQREIDKELAQAFRKYFSELAKEIIKSKGEIINAEDDKK